MLRRCVFFITVAILLSSNALADGPSTEASLEDLAVRESLYLGSQGEWFEALLRLQQPDSIKDSPVFSPSMQSEVARNGFELSYRMHLHAARVLSDGFQNSVDDETRNGLLFRLAEIYFQKGMPVDALQTLERINGEVSPEIKVDLAFLRAQVLMANGRFDPAINILNDLNQAQKILGFAGYGKKAQSLLGFTGYNLGLAYLLSNNKAEGYRQLDLAGQVNNKDEIVQSIRDKTNLMFGEQLLKDGLYKEAGAIFDRVRLSGPFSNPSLLSTGWASVAQENYQQALVPWTLLAERDVTDAAVQEAIIAVPYCYGKLGIYSKAAPLYAHAEEVFGREIDKLTDSIANISKGHFTKALLQEDIKQNANWVVALRELPDAPETFYLLDLMVTHEFQQALKNYIDLQQLSGKLTGWQRDLLIFEEMIKKRRSYYRPLLPVIDTRLKNLNVKLKRLVMKRNKISRKLAALKDKPRPDYFATAEEREYFDTIDRLDLSLKPYHIVKTEARIKRLRGLLYWSIYANYEQRLASANAGLSSLNEDIAAIQDQLVSLDLIRKTAKQSYTGHNKPIKTLRTKIKNALEKTTSAMAEQGKILESMAESELVKRREKLEEMQIKARFAMAESYDRAAKKAGGGGR